VKVNLVKIDHVHIYVHDLDKAERWYNDVLGFSRDESLLFWFKQGGPLVLKNNAAAISLFLRTHQPPGNTVAFSLEATSFCPLLHILAAQSIPFIVSDHQVSMSVYFSDPDGNQIELTSYQYSEAKENLAMSQERLREG
jgi:catechol-2,3-dioxygenase